MFAEKIKNSSIALRIAAAVALAAALIGACLYLDEDVGYDTYYQTVHDVYAEKGVRYSIEHVDEGTTFSRWMLISALASANFCGSLELPIHVDVPPIEW